MLARAVALLTLAVLAAAACSSESDPCGSGTTKVCLPDGTTCACAPSCRSESDCNQYTVCLDGTCTSCPSEKCVCSSKLCAPSSWHSVQQLTFKR